MELFALFVRSVCDGALPEIFFVAATDSSTSFLVLVDLCGALLMIERIKIDVVRSVTTQRKVLKALERLSDLQRNEAVSEKG